MSRLFICGITSTETDKIKDLIDKTKDYVDGYVWCVDSNFNSDETFLILNANKKKGEIVRHKWQNAHDWQANEWLHCGILKNGDYYLICDSTEIPTEKWLKSIRQNIEEMKQQNIGAIYMSGRPYLIEFQDTQYFNYTPHWGLFGIHHRNITSYPEERKSDLIINKRDINPEKHYQEHDTKYYLYARSNQMQMFYGKYGQEVVNFHEEKRLEFRDYLGEQTDLNPSLKALGLFFVNHHPNVCGLKWTDYEIEMMELEFCLSEYYQRTVLKMNFMGTRPEISDGMHPRKQWSFKNHLKYGDGWYDKDYKGTILKYNEEFGIKE